MLRVHACRPVCARLRWHSAGLTDVSCGPAAKYTLLEYMQDCHVCSNISPISVDLPRSTVRLSGGRVIIVEYRLLVVYFIIEYRNTGYPRMVVSQGPVAYVMPDPSGWSYQVIAQEVCIPPELTLLTPPVHHGSLEHGHVNATFQTSVTWGHQPPTCFSTRDPQ